MAFKVSRKPVWLGLRRILGVVDRHRDHDLAVGRGLALGWQTQDPRRTSFLGWDGEIDGGYGAIKSRISI